MRELWDLIVTDVRAVEVIGVPFSIGLIPPWNPSQCIKARDYVVVRIETNEGVWGLSLDGEYSPGLPATAADINDLVKPYLVGKRVMDMEAHTRYLHSIRPHGRFFFVAAALWDIAGKAIGLPLFRLWGGKRAKIRVYASTVQHGLAPKERAEHALAFLERGYRAIKLRGSGQTVDDVVGLVAAVRDAVGNRMAIMVDANQSGRRLGDGRPGPIWNLARAQETARRLGELGVAYLEEPLPYTMIEEGVILRESSPIPIAGGEGKRGIGEFHSLIQKGVYDIIQPDPIVGGTPTDMLKIVALTEAAGLPFVFHHGKSGLGFMIGLHLSAATGESPWLEYMDDGAFWQPRGFQVGFREVMPVDHDGYVHCPEAAGLGIDWDTSWLRKNRLD